MNSKTIVTFINNKVYSIIEKAKNEDGTYVEISNKYYFYKDFLSSFAHYIFFHFIHYLMNRQKKKYYTFLINTKIYAKLKIIMKQVRICLIMNMEYAKIKQQSLNL